LRIADCGLRIAGCGLRIADCGLMQFSILVHVRVKQAQQSAICNLLEPGTVIALKVSHCIHIAFGSRVAPEAVWMVMV